MKTRLRNAYAYVLEELTQYAPTRGVVFILSLSLIGWGLWTMNPFVTTFANPIYDVMTIVATEPAWGAAFVFAGANLMYGAVRKKADAVKRGAMVGWLMWVLVAIMYALADPTATVVVTNVCLALMHAWIYIQAELHPELLTGQIRITDLENYVKEKGERT